MSQGIITTFVVVNDKDQYSSEEMPTMDEAVRAAQQLAAQTGRKYAVVQFEYEFADSGLVWTPNGSDQWPPKDAKFIRTRIDGRWVYICPTGLCGHLFEEAELPPGDTVMCPECGAMLQVAQDFPTIPLTGAGGQSLN